MSLSKKRQKKRMNKVLLWSSAFVLAGAVGMSQTEPVQVFANVMATNVWKLVSSTSFADKDEAVKSPVIQEESKKALDAITPVWKARSLEETKAEIQRQKDAKLSHYVIQWGDTLGMIALATDQNVDELAKVNGLTDKNKILTGDILQGVLNKEVTKATAATSTEMAKAEQEAKQDTTTTNPVAPSTKPATPSTPEKPSTPAVDNTVKAEDAKKQGEEIKAAIEKREDLTDVQKEDLKKAIDTAIGNGEKLTQDKINEIKDKAETVKPENVPNVAEDIQKDRKAELEAKRNALLAEAQAFIEANKDYITENDKMDILLSAGRSNSIGTEEFMQQSEAQMRELMAKVLAYKPATETPVPEQPAQPETPTQPETPVQPETPKTEHGYPAVWGGLPFVALNTNGMPVYGPRQFESFQAAQDAWLAGDPMVQGFDAYYVDSFEGVVNVYYYGNVPKQ